MDSNSIKILQEWHQLLKDGLISNDDFAKKKAELLGLPQLEKPEIEIQPDPFKAEDVTEIFPPQNFVVPPPVPDKEPGVYDPIEKQTEIIPDEKEIPVKKKSLWPMITVAAVLLLATLGVLSYFFYFKEKWLDDKSPRYFVSATSVSLRSTKVAGVDNNYIGSTPYGAELITYDYQPDWSYVKMNGKKGYVSSKYILNKEDFFLLNNIFGDAVTKEAIETNKCRMALLDYIKRITTDSAQRLNWKIFTRPKDVKPNTIYYARLVNSSSRFTDFVFIMKNITTNERKLALYSFGDDETPIFVTEQYAPNDGNIKNASKEFNGNYTFYYQ